MVGGITSGIAAASGDGPINWSNVIYQSAIGGQVNGGCNFDDSRFFKDFSIGLISAYSGGEIGRSAAKVIFSSLASPSIRGSVFPAMHMAQTIGAGATGSLASFFVSDYLNHGFGDNK